MRSAAVLLAALIVVPAFSADVALETEDQKTLYALGAFLGQRASAFALDEKETELAAAGFKDSALGKPIKVDLQQFGPKVGQLQQARAQARSAAEKSKAKPFLEKMKKEKGAQVLPNGAIVIPMKAGSGDTPKASDKVKVHYHGTLLDGTVFDSSVERKQPIDFPLTGVIPCWTEGVQKIKKGGKSKLVCPSEVAYGDNGSPPKIPGGATLVFEVELLDIVK